MAKQTFDIGFLCRQSKTNRLGLAPIEMSIIINGKRTYLQMQMKAHPEDFKVAMAGKGFPEIQEYCIGARKKIDTLLLDMASKDIPVTADLLKQFFINGGTVRNYTLNDMFSEYLAILHKRVGNDLTEDTYNRYVRTTKMFLEHNNLNGDTPAKTITLQHFLQYQAGLGQKMDPATSCNYLQKIRTFFLYAFNTGKIPTNPSYGMKIDKGIKQTILYLTQDEVAKIRNKKFSTERLQRTADVFLFACYTGLAYADMALLEKKDFKVNKYGYTYVEKTRQKTGAKFCAILLEDAKSIAEKYDYTFNMRTDQKVNEYLKEIAELTGIDKPLHFHMARHTAAAYLLNYRPAIPNETICKIMGWKSEKQLRHYAAIFNATIFEDISKAFAPKTKPPKPEPISHSIRRKEIDEERIAARELMKRHLR